MHERERVAKHKPIGPFAPPYPAEASETRGGEPMAVANDKANTHGESFVGTSAPRDQWDDEVAKKYGRAVSLPRSDKETRAAQRPDGYTAPDEYGWVKPNEEP